jgi:hypothetical protein
MVGSGGGIDRVFTTTGKQYDDLKKNTMDKTLENTLKTGMNTKLPTCHDKGGGCHMGLTEWFESVLFDL